MTAWWWAHFNAYLALAEGLWRTRSAANALGVVFCAAFAFVSLAFGVLLHRVFRVPLWAARAALRMFFTLWLVIAFRWIDVWPVSWVAAAFFVYANFYARDHGWTKCLIDPDDPDEEPLGNAWALLTLVFLWWWPGYQFMVMAGVVASWLGGSVEEFASLWPHRHRFRFRGGRAHSFESIAAMAVATLAAIFTTNYLCAEIPGVIFGPWAFIGAVLTTGVTTVAFLYSPRPYQQWLTPLLGSATMYFYAKAGFQF
jgi:hypothetical protein